MTGYLSGLGGVFGTSGATTTSTANYGWITQTQTAATGFTNSTLVQQAQMQQMYLQQSQATLQQIASEPWFRKLAAGEYDLPDGAKLVIDSMGNYHVLDATAKVVYRACRVREFNPYINASDLLEAFIREVGMLDGVDQDDVLRLPIEAFINWIILQAAKRDGDPLDDLPSVESAIARIPVLPDGA